MVKKQRWGIFGMRIITATISGGLLKLPVESLWFERQATGNALAISVLHQGYRIGFLFLIPRDSSAVIIFFNSLGTVSP